MSNVLHLRHVPLAKFYLSLDMLDENGCRYFDRKSKTLSHSCQYGWAEDPNLLIKEAKDAGFEIFVPPYLAHLVDVEPPSLEELEESKLKKLMSFLEEQKMKLIVELKTGYDEGTVYEASPSTVLHILENGETRVCLSLKECGGW